MKTKAASKEKKHSPTFAPESAEHDNKKHDFKDQPKDGFVNKETIAKTVAKVPAVKTKDLSGSLKETHGPTGATAWETAGDAHKNPSVRSFHGSKPNRA